MIQVEDLSFSYRDSDGVSIHAVDLKVKKGELIVLTGLSGCGKSTILKCLNGLIPHHYEGDFKGRVLINGNNTLDMTIPQVSQQVGSVFQDARGQFFTTDVYSELAFSMENFGYDAAFMKARITELATLMGLSKLLEQNIFSISSGERQCLGIACALTLDAHILLFDEPSANLDYTTTMKLRRLLMEMKEKGHTIIVADHRLFYLQGIFDVLVHIEDGTIKDRLTPKEASRTESGLLRSFHSFKSQFENLGIQRGDLVLDVQNLSYRNILKDISFSLYRGDIMAVVGKNGAGKTTLGRLLCEIEKPEVGKITTGNKTLFIMQDVDYQLFGYSVSSELKLGNGNATKSHIADALEKTGLLPWKDRHPFALSGGQKQRLTISLSLLSEADVVIFDEPTSGLDALNMQRVVEIIKEVAKRKAVLVISHDYEFITKSCKSVLHLQRGTIKDRFDFKAGKEARLQNIFKQMEETNYGN